VRAEQATWLERQPVWVWDVAFALAVILVVSAAAIFPEVRQDPAYHRFADRRALWGIPNALDVLSNAGFLVVGALGLLAARRPGAVQDPRARAGWLVLFAAVAATSAGSAYYHLAPSDARLAWDRLPMSAGFMALVAVLLGERFGAAVGRHLLGRLVLGGVATVAWWDLGNSRPGGGNLLPYLIVQYGSMAAIPVLLAGRPAAAGPRAPWVVALVLYAAAKGLEAEDRSIFALAGVSGHTLKHLVAAAAIGVLALELRRRSRAARAG